MVPVMSVVLMGTDGAWEKKKIPMPRIEEKEEAREEKKGENGAWEKKKDLPCPES